MSARSLAVDPARFSGLLPLTIAVALIGKGEATGNNDGEFVAQLLGETPAAARKQRLAWCAAFVQRCFEWAGRKLPVNFWEARAVAHLQKEMARLGWLVDPEQPQPGDIIFFRTRVGSDAGTGNHVGIVERVDGPFVHTIEGNTSNAVQRRTHAIGTEKIWCLARVPAPKSNAPRGCARGA